MAGKRLTVIIPGYNNPEKWWCRCVDSVLSNISENDEIICVDDCSSVIPRCLYEYRRRDSRIKVIRQIKNGGLSVARNSALEIADGEFVTFVDSDDEILPQTYPRVIDVMKNEKVDIALFGVRAVWCEERLMSEMCPANQYIGVGEAEDFRKLYDQRLLNYVWNKVFRLSFLKDKKIQFHPNGMPCEDIIFVLKCIMAGAKWITVAHIGINYYRTWSTLLSCYKQSYCKGVVQASEVWRQYKMYDKMAQKLFGNIGEPSREALILGEWDNMWRLKSPYCLLDKWRFLKNNKDIAHGSLFLFFMRKVIYQFFRNYFYIRSIRCWHIKRIYPQVKYF